MRPIVFSVAAATVAFGLFALLGITAPPRLGAPLSTEATVRALSFSFPMEGNLWLEPSGHASHGWLYRRAYVEGMSAGRGSTRYSEQVLKVGWPFTVVRGFIWREGVKVTGSGVGWKSEMGPAGTARLLPVQPVWPGILFYGLVGIILSRVRRPRRRDAVDSTSPHSRQDRSRIGPGGIQ